MGVRIFTLAKELDMTSKELITFLKTQGHQVTSHMSSIDDQVAKILRDRLKPKSAEPEAAKPKAAKEAPAAATGSKDKSDPKQKSVPATGGRKKKVRRFSQPMSTARAEDVSPARIADRTGEAARHRLNRGSQ